MEKEPVLFDEMGNELPPEAEFDSPAPEHEPEEPEIEEPEENDGGEPEQAAEGKYRIGDKTFQTQAEAYAYAQSLTDEEPESMSALDAYRQAIIDSRQQGIETESVTQDDFNEEEYYADPKAYFQKFKQQIREEVVNEVTQSSSQQAQSDAIWRDFSDRHPKLASFRNEVEQYAAANQTAVQKIVKKQGREAAYDYIALNLAQQFSKYAQAVTPKRQLRNASTQGAPSGGTGGVTPKKQVKKPMSFTEQIRSLKRSR